MVEVYFYIPARQVINAVECGMKLSEWYDKEVEIKGGRKKCISALLNPRDDCAKYKSAEYKCIKLEIMPKYCYVADSLLYRAGLDNSEVMGMYESSVIPLESYTFGRYRLPECLVTCTVVGGYVSVLDKRLDSPILFNSSEELYMNNVIEELREIYDDFDDTALYFFFENMSNNGTYREIKGVGDDLAVYVHEKDRKIYTIKIPDFGKY